MSHYHFIGIGGAGLAPIARFLLEKGHEVSGSDLHESVMTEELIELGVEITIGHHEKNILNSDMIIRSSAIPDNNVEVKAGKKAGIPVIKRLEFLKELTSGKEVIAVSGTHGKTTTTAMIAWCLTNLSLDPSYVIGGISKNLGTNAHAGSGEFFVIEADEYDHMFLGLTPKILVITNVEHDHPDHYPTEEIYFEAFLELTSRVKSNGVLVACGDDPGANNIAESSKGDLRKYLYGTQPSYDYFIQNINHAPGCGVNFEFKSKHLNQSEKPIKTTLLIPGTHNALNAGAAFAVIHQLGYSVRQAANALQEFSGTGRRFDIKGEINGITVIDDYAHHPSEIRATLATARCLYPDKRIWCVWQPHTYSRTKQLIKDFATSFQDCDHVIISEIFASRENVEDYSSREIVHLIHHSDVRYIANLSEIISYLINTLSAGDVLLVLSAGDADQISQDVLNYLDQEGKNND